MTYLAIPTLAGQAALAATLEDPTHTIQLSRVVVGDGAGEPVLPVETMTRLINQRADVPISSITRDGNKLVIDGVLDETIGGFTVREVGVVDVSGTLLFVMSFPATPKGLLAENVEDTLTVGLVIVVSDTANVTLMIDGATYASHTYVNTAIADYRDHVGTPLRPWHTTVVSMTVAAPPALPNQGDTYLVPSSPSGGWAGRTGQLAQNRSGVWVFAEVPPGHVVSAADTGLIYQRIGTTWVPVLPANAQGWLRNDGIGGKSWGDPFDIAGLPARDPALDDQFAFHDVSVGEKSKSSIRKIADMVARDTHSNSFFLGMM